jgi:hypothetical protein
MAALQGHVSLPSTALTAATAKTIFRVKAATNQRARILGYGFFFDGTLNSAQPVQVRIGRITADGAAPTALTINPNEDELTETFQTSVATSTTEPTYAATVLKTITIHPQLGYEYLAPLGQEIIVKGAGMLGFEVNAPATVNVRGYLMFEE